MIKTADVEVKTPSSTGFYETEKRRNGETAKLKNSEFEKQSSFADSPIRRFAHSTVEEKGEMVYIPAGNPFFIDKFEYPNQRGVLPLTGLTYTMAKDVCSTIGKRLCSDWEWTIACEGPDRDVYSTDESEGICTKCNSRLKRGILMASGGLPECKSGYGVNDLSGNVWEWVGRESEYFLMLKGGSYSEGADMPLQCKKGLIILNSLQSKIDTSTFGVRCCKSIRNGFKR